MKKQVRDTLIIVGVAVLFFFIFTTLFNTLDNIARSGHNYCICHNYTLDKYCTKCQRLQPKTMWIDWCSDCNEQSVGEYCGHCGHKTFEKEVERWKEVGKLTIGNNSRSIPVKFCTVTSSVSFAGR